MSNFTIPYRVPEGEGGSGSARVPATVLGALAAGLLLALPGQARADGGSYGHAEITLGFPHAQVTVGRTWDDDPRPVVVEEVTHKVPDPDWDDDRDDDRDHSAEYDDDADEPDQVIIEKRHERPRVQHVTIIERYEEPSHCDRAEVVRRVYVERPSCPRPNVVIYRSEPRHVIYAPSRTVIVAPRGGYRDGGHNWRVEDRGYHGGDHGSGPRNLFPEDQGRPVRMRGVQHQLVQVGASR
jgi:hypothetical protein